MIETALLLREYTAFHASSCACYFEVMPDMWHMLAPSVCSALLGHTWHWVDCEAIDKDRGLSLLAIC